MFPPCIRAGRGQKPEKVSGGLQYSLVAQTVKRLSAIQETRVQSLGWEDPLEKEMATHSSILAWKIPGSAVHGVAKSQKRLSYFTSLQYSQAQLKCLSQPCLGVLGPGPCAASGVLRAHPPSAPSDLEGAFPPWAEVAAPTFIARMCVCV